MKPLTLERLDRMMENIGTPPKRSSLATESLWGASAIAKFMGVSDDFVRSMAKRQDTPIRWKAGRYYCTRTEIVTWLSSPDRK